MSLSGFFASFLWASCALLVHGSDTLLEFAAIRQRAADIHGDIVAWRRELHRWPELMYQENMTSAFIQEVLRGMDVRFTTGWSKNTRQDRILGTGGTGVVAEIGSGRPPIVALRTDMDALPILEETAVSFQSKHIGKMHACGHDGHIAMLLGAAKLLNEFAGLLAGTVRLIFQPAEEGGAGAKRMQEEGVLKDVSRIFGMHLWPGLPSGSIGGRAGVTMGAGDFFEFRIVGKGAHGAMPQQGVDPVTAAAAIIQSLQTLVARETDPLDAAVVSVTKMHAGDAFNVIPGEAMLGGTIRALSTRGIDRLRSRLVEVAEGVARAHRCSIEDVRFMPDHFPPTSNNPELWNWLESTEAGIKESTVGLSMHMNLDPTMGSEDFAFYTQEVSGAFIFLGQGTGRGDVATNVSVHNPRFNMDESVLDLGAAIHTQLALRSLSSLQHVQARSEL